MTVRVELTARALRDLRRLYERIDAANSAAAPSWFAGLERLILSLDEHPERGGRVPEDGRLRQVLYGRGRSVDRVIYASEPRRGVVRVIHVRHSAREAMRAAEAG